MPLILASASLRRPELLANAGIAFTVEPAHVAEKPSATETPVEYVKRLAREKAHMVFARHPTSAVLGADTVAVVDGHLLEKPNDLNDAARMLRLLSDKTHEAITGVCLLAPGFELTEVEVTQVLFSALSENEIASYVQTNEPMGRAGAYKIQGIASRWAERIEGCYFNVMGMPIPRVCRMLKIAEAITGMALTTMTIRSG